MCRLSPLTPLLRASCVLVLILWLQACSTMSANECRQANWRDVGFRDGLAGAPLRQLDRRIKDCAEAGVTIQVPAYLLGRNEGLPSYCRLDNAARLGLEGKAYQGVCAAGIDAEFRRRHAMGMDVYRARSELRNLDQRRRHLEDRLADARNDEERRRTREDLRDLDNTMRRTRDRVREAEWALDQLR
jgi:hypothetical protein